VESDSVLVVATWVVRLAVCAIGHAVAIAITVYAVRNAIAVAIATVLVVVVRRFGYDTPSHHTANDDQYCSKRSHFCRPWFNLDCCIETVEVSIAYAHPNWHQLDAV
jgi:hypothetical protein